MSRLASILHHRERQDHMPGQRCTGGLRRVAKAFPDADARDGDGLRLDWSDRWVQVRASNTEPIIRIIAEAPETTQAVALIDQAMQVVADSVAPFLKS